MSGPIIRKYGFPNFEKIFGERELKHGAEADASKPESAPLDAPKTDQEPPTTSSGSEPPKNPAV